MLVPSELAQPTICDSHLGRTQFEYKPKTTYPEHTVIAFTPKPLRQLTGYYLEMSYHNFNQIIRCILLHNRSVISHFNSDKYRVDAAS